MRDALLLAANSSSLLSTDGILFVLGGIAGLLAMLGLLLLVPLYLTQRGEVERLLDWMDREPEAGTTEFRAIDPSARAAGGMTPAERVTSERPALARISTAEHDAIALRDAPLWRRVIDRGPRHPLVIAIVALLAAVAIVAAAGILIRSDEEEPKRGGIERGDVQIAVVNASSTAGVADMVGDGLGDRGFDIVSTGATSDAIPKTKVQYAEGQKKAGRVVVRTLELPNRNATEFDAEGEAAANDAADVVIFVGEDLEAPREDGEG